MDVLNRPAFSTANQIKRNPIISLRASAFFSWPPVFLFEQDKGMNIFHSGSGSKLRSVSLSAQTTMIPSHYSQLQQTHFFKIHCKFIYHPLKILGFDAASNISFIFTSLASVLTSYHKVF